MQNSLQPLIDYIKHHLTAGTHEQTIRRTLEQANWHPEHIEQGMSHAKTQLGSELSKQTSTSAEFTPLHNSSRSKSAKTITITEAAKQTIQSFKVNPVKITLSFAIGLFGVFIGVFLLGLLFIPFLIPAISALLDPTIGGILLLTVLILVGTIFSSAISALFISISGLGFNYGAEKQKIPLRALFTTVRQRLWRVTVAEIAFWLLAYIPFFALLGLFVILIPTTGSGFEALAILPIVLFITIVWTIIVLFRYALVNYVVLFEQPMPLKTAFRRSDYLLKNGGKWFLFKLLLVAFVILLLIGAMTGLDPDEVSNSDNPIINIITVILSVFWLGIITMLYRNRVAVRGTEKG